MKQTTAQKVWEYLTELAQKKQSNNVRVSVGTIAKHAGCAERSVQYAWRKLEGKVERILHKGNGANYKNELNEYIIHEFCTHVDNSKSKVFAPIKNLKAFKDLKDLKAEDEIFSPSDTDSPEIHIKTENRTSELPLLIERNLPHLVQGYALTVVDFVMNKFKRLLKMGKITHMIAWIRGALANEQAIYDAIGFDMYISRGKQADRNKSASTSAPKSAPRAKKTQPINRPSNRPSRPSLPMPVYEAPVVEQSEVERILAMAREYQKEKTACAV